MNRTSFADFIARWDASTMRLIDVRETYEWNELRVKGAELHPLSMIQAGTLPTPDGRETFVLCRMGGRSAVAAQVFEKMGFDTCTNIEDGIIGAYPFDAYLESGPTQ